MDIHKFKGKVPDVIYERLQEKFKRPDIRVGSIIKIIGCNNSFGQPLNRIGKYMGEEHVVIHFNIGKWSDITGKYLVIGTNSIFSLAWELGHFEVIKY